MRVTGASVAITAALLSTSTAQLLTITTPSLTSPTIVSSSATSFPSATFTGEPCAVVSSVVSAYSADPNNLGSIPFVSPSKALACLDAVPLDSARSSSFIDYLNPFLQFQSTLAYLKNPPTEYILPGVDVIGGLGEIKKNLRSGNYNSQWAFEKDVNALINIMPKDFHLGLDKSLPLSQVFSFSTSLHLVSLSTDGLQVPKVYVKSKGKGRGWISEFLNTFGLKDTSSFIFANDTSTPKIFPNFAYINGDFSSINSGSDLFALSVLPHTTTANSTTSAAIKERSLPTDNAYPKNPIAQHPQGYISGYFLDGHDDTCVLQMNAFQGSNTTDPNDSADIQSTVQSVLSQCTAAGKTKLIIDLSANGGGLIFNGYDAFKQLFPTLEPFGGSRVRATPAAHYFIDLLSGTGIYNARENTVYQTQANVDIDGKAFPNAEVLYGPYEYRHDNFSAELRQNLSDPTQHTITISGYGDRSNITSQPFKSENIIMVMDGLCGSTCSIFAELLKTSGGVRSIAVGGRPQTGPMQYVAGSKGSEVYPYVNIQTLLNFVPTANQSLISQGKQLPSLPPPEWIPSLENPPLGPPLGTGAPNFNLRNAYKPNDATQTPLQFIYEAANCRIFYALDDLFQVENLWKRVYQTTWGNLTCVPDSTTTSDNKIPTLANATVPFSSKFVSNVTNPFTGPGSLKPSSTLLSTPTPSTSPSATSSNPPAATKNNGSSLKSSSGVSSLALGILFVFV